MRRGMWHRQAAELAPRGFGHVAAAVIGVGAYSGYPQALSQRTPDSAL
jgi:hypothetical protein